MDYDAFGRERCSHPLRRVNLAVSSRICRQPTLYTSLLSVSLTPLPVTWVNPAKNHSVKLLGDSPVDLSSTLPRILKAWNRRKSSQTARPSTSTPLPRQRCLIILSSGGVTPLRIVSSPFHQDSIWSSGSALEPTHKRVKRVPRTPHSGVIHHLNHI
jgi:hypothetical protein